MRVNNEQMLIEYLVSNPFVAVLTLSVGWLLLSIFSFYSNVRSLPRGPLPLPLLGNILAFANKGDRMPNQIITDFRKQHGPVFTFWAGTIPQVIVADSKIAKEALMRADFAARPKIGAMHEIFWGKDASSLVFSEFSREWEVLRKVSHSAVRKFAVSEKLPLIMDKKVRTVLREIERQNGEKPFNPAPYTEFLLISLFGTTTYSREFEMSDPDFESLHYAFKVQTETFNVMYLMAFMPIFKYIFRKEFKKVLQISGTQREYATKQYKEHQRTYTEGVIRDFTDAVICAKREAEAEDSKDAKYLKDANIVNTILDIFIAGTETTSKTLLWVLLFLSNYPDRQKVIREEVEAAIDPQDVPDLKHKDQCHLLQAFILEVMRIRAVAPLGVPRETTTDTELAGQKIRKGITVMVSLDHCLKDKEVWGDPEVFRPERFLDENNLIKHQFFVPFGSGRRGCLGEKLALNNLFLMVSGLIHGTRGKLMVLPEGPGSVDLTPSPDHDVTISPRSYKVVFK